MLTVQAKTHSHNGEVIPYRCPSESE